MVLVLRNSAFLTFGNPLLLSGVNEIIPFQQAQNITVETDYVVVDVTIPSDVEAGEYMFFILLVEAGDNVLDDFKWLSEEELAFTIN